MCGISPVSGASKSRSNQEYGQAGESDHGHGAQSSSAHPAGPNGPDGTSSTQHSASTSAPGSGGTGSKGLIDEINRVRAMHGLAPVEEKPNLNDAAAANDEANVSTGELAHHNGLINGASGEITAMASDGETPEEAVQQWLDSPEHRAILLDPNMKYVGGSINGSYATADFS